MVGVAERTHCEHRPDQVEFEDFDFHCRLGKNVGNRQQLVAQQLHGGYVVGAAGKLALQLDAAEGIGAEVLDRIAEDLAVPTIVNTLSGVSRPVANRPISLTVPVTPPAVMKSPTLNGFSTMRKAPAARLDSSPPRRRDGDADAGDQGGEGRRLHPK